jgi:hypothetical protein
MMKIMTLICGALCCAVMSGCVVHDNHRHGRPHATRAKIIVPVPVVVETHAPAKHCPPGQAKKGNC